MANPITVGLSPLTNTIFAGRSQALKGGNPEARCFTGDKHDVTEQAIHAVAFHLMKTDDIKVFKLPDGRELHLRADIKEASHD